MYVELPCEKVEIPSLWGLKADQAVDQLIHGWHMARHGSGPKAQLYLGQQPVWWSSTTWAKILHWSKHTLFVASKVCKESRSKAHWPRLPFWFITSANMLQYINPTVVPSCHQRGHATPRRKHMPARLNLTWCFKTRFAQVFQRLPFLGIGALCVEASTWREWGKMHCYSVVIYETMFPTDLWLILWIEFSWQYLTSKLF